MDNNFEKMLESVGQTAEMAVLFYNAAVNAGASPEVAVSLYSAFISAMIDGNRKA